MTHDDMKTMAVWASRAIGAFAKDDQAVATHNQAVRLRIEAGGDFAKMADDWRNEHGDMTGWPAHLDATREFGYSRATKLIRLFKDLGHLLEADSPNIDRAVILDAQVFQQLESLPPGERRELATGLAEGTKTPDDVAVALKERDAAKEAAKKLRKTAKAVKEELEKSNAEKQRTIDELVAKVNAKSEEAVDLQARLEAVEGGLEVAPPQIVQRVDPVLESNLRAANELTAAQAREVEELTKRNEKLSAMLEVSRENALKDADRKMKDNAPQDYATMFLNGVTEEYLRRVKAAVELAKRQPRLFMDETSMTGVREVMALLDRLEDLRLMVPEG